MPLFESKPELSIEECCRQFYDSNIFHSKIIAGQDLWSMALDTIRKSVAGVDQSFISIDQTLFRNEMTALRMELFAFALGCSKKYKTDKYTLPQSFFTRSYLEENGRLDLWDIMGEYNQVIAKSATVYSKGNQYSGHRGEAKIISLNSRRVNAGEEWIKANVVNSYAMTQEEEHKLKCAIRVINRFGADTEREDDVVVKLLCSKLANRLGCDVNLESEALFRLATTIYGFYKGAEDYLNSVDLKG
jgi:hypothetical protein